MCSSQTRRSSVPLSTMASSSESNFASCNLWRMLNLRFAATYSRAICFGPFIVLTRASIICRASDDADDGCSFLLRTPLVGVASTRLRKVGGCKIYTLLIPLSFFLPLIDLRGRYGEISRCHSTIAEDLLLFVLALVVTIVRV